MLTSPQNKSVYQEVTLSARLSAIAESLPEKSVVCDVGSDHGWLPLYLLKNGLCEKAIVTDLNEKPLARAKQNLMQAGVDQKAVFVQTDGIDAVLSMKPDVFVIAGMGGETICGILNRAVHRIPVGTFFVLQPMTKSVELRRYLYQFGFRIRSERAVLENDKVFLVLDTIYDGIKREEKLSVSEFGEFLPFEKSESAKEFFVRALSSVEGVIRGKDKASIPCDEEKQKRDEILRILEEIHESQRD